MQRSSLLLQIENKEMDLNQLTIKYTQLMDDIYKNKSVNHDDYDVEHGL